MTPAARLQCVIEVFDTYDPEKGPLSPFIKNAFKARRYAGSSDRRTITDILYRIMRASPLLLEGLEDSKEGRLMVLAFLKLLENQSLEEIKALFTGPPYGPALLSAEEQTILGTLATYSPSPSAQAFLPPWLYEKLAKRYTPETFEALKEKAPVDLRVNLNHLSRPEAQQHLTHAILTPYSPLGLRLSTGPSLDQHPLIQQGLLDVQDEGSQLIALIVHALQVATILDLCAGAGGKSLALAELRHNAEGLSVTDIDSGRLTIAQKRAQERQIVLHFLEYNEALKGSFDCVLVDTPCSGTGTLRRHPELKIGLTPKKIEEYVQTQQYLLSQARTLVKEGGYLVYATCSLLEEENDTQIEWFLNAFPEFQVLPLKDLGLDFLPPGSDPYLHLDPGRHHTDGFFVGVLQNS
jgi:16S rRNA (cytosine967-C5)-methyltransferase